MMNRVPPTTGRARLLTTAIACLCAGLLTWAQDAPVPWRLVGPGVEHARFARGTTGPEGSTGPWTINLLRVDPARVTLDVVHAMDEAVGLETVSSLAARHGAMAAVNGGYFQTTGTYRGDSIGTLQIDGALLSEPDRGRAAVGLVRTDTSTRVILGHITSRATVVVGGSERPLDGLNRPRGENEIILFTPGFHRTTLTGPNGLEVVVRRGVVDAVRDGAGSSPIPADGVVLSARGEARLWLLAQAREGVRVETTIGLLPADGSAENPWTRAEDVVGAGPKIVSGGRVDVTVERESMLPAFSTDRHPRTAVGTLVDGRVLLAAVDGRRPPFSIGMTLDELARLMIECGVVEAMNLDGGGSTTMVVEGKVVNTPSDASGERPVSDAILVRVRR